MRYTTARLDREEAGSDYVLRTKRLEVPRDDLAPMSQVEFLDWKNQALDKQLERVARGECCGREPLSNGWCSSTVCGAALAYKQRDLPDEQRWLCPRSHMTAAWWTEAMVEFLNQLEQLEA